MGVSLSPVIHMPPPPLFFFLITFFSQPLDPLLVFRRSFDYFFDLRESFPSINVFLCLFSVDLLSLPFSHALLFLQQFNDSKC